MSNETQHDGNPGRRNRNRSRGGRGRNQGQNRNQNRNHNNNREFIPSEFAGRKRNPKPEPVRLTWWQKLLKMIGLYKAPTPPARQPQEAKGKSPVRSNTRIAGGGSEDGSQRQPREPREQREPREPRERREPREPRERRELHQAEVDSSRLYVGNLSYEATESDLEELFKGVGTVRSVEVIYNRNTHRSKGYAFVEMIHMDEAKRAVEVLHDQPFMGRKLLVSGAKSKEAREDEQARAGDDAPPAARPTPAPTPTPTPAPVQAETPAHTETPAAAPTESPAPAETPASHAPVTESPAAETHSTEETTPAA